MKEFFSCEVCVSRSRCKHRLLRKNDRDHHMSMRITLDLSLTNLSEHHHCSRVRSLSNTGEVYRRAKSTACLVHIKNIAPSSPIAFAPRHSDSHPFLSLLSSMLVCVCVCVCVCVKVRGTVRMSIWSDPEIDAQET